MNPTTALNSVPEAEGEVLEPHALAEVKHYRLEDEDGPGRAEDGERLPGQEAVGDSNDEAGDEGLDSSDPVMYDRRNWSHMVTCYILSRVTPVLGGVAEESAEGDDGGEARKVDEDVRGDRLHGQRVFEVGQVTGREWENP